MPVEMRLTKIVISELNENQLIFLREVEGDRQFPIVIGIFEATSIDRRVKGNERPRPLTHDLLVGAISALGGELDSILINNLENGTYYASLQIMHEGEMVSIDARPSDAIAVAVSTDPPLPIFVEEEVIESAIKPA